MMQAHRPTLSPAEAEQTRAVALLKSGAARLELPLDSSTLSKLLRYQSLLTEWGAKINLTALRDPRDVMVRHFLDSLALVRSLPAGELLPNATLVDVGSGAGFPGALCALFRPDLRVTRVERVGKKAAFLLALRRELGLTYTVEASDATKLCQPDPHGFGIVVSRAALPLPDWLKLAGRLAAPQGFVFAMTTPREPLPTSTELSLHSDISYDVGAGPHRLVGWQRA